MFIQNGAGPTVPPNGVARLVSSVSVLNTVRQGKIWAVSAHKYQTTGQDFVSVRTEYQTTGQGLVSVRTEILHHRAGFRQCLHRIPNHRAGFGQCPHRIPNHRAGFGQCPHRNTTPQGTGSSVVSTQNNTRICQCLHIILYTTGQDFVSVDTEYTVLSVSTYNTTPQGRISSVSTQNNPPQGTNLPVFI